MTYTATFTADDGFTGTGSVSVAAGSYTDAAGNPGGAGSDTVAIDTQNPTVAVDIVDGALSDGDNSSVVTFTFSEAPAGFTPSDIAADGRHGERPDADGRRPAGLHGDLHRRRRLHRHRLGVGGGGQLYRRGPQRRRAGSDTVTIDTREPDAWRSTSSTAR